MTRTVVLIGRWAIKAPAARNGWAMFLNGLLANIEEAKFSPLHGAFGLCPVSLAIPGGWLSMQPRCQPLTDEQWGSIANSGPDWNGMHCDFKRDNFGVCDGRVMLLDYGRAL